MARKTEAKCRQCRREGEKLYLKGEKCFTGKCPVVQRNFPPGVHGPTSRTRLTPFGVQLREKQKAKNMYGILERQFHNYFERATRKVGNTGDFLVQILEMRLDNVVYRLGLSKSRSMARQLVSHGHVLVNGKRVDIPSFSVKSGDVVSLKPTILTSKLMENAGATLEKHTTPAWLLLDPKEKSGKILAKPEGQDLRQGFDPKLIVEFYSR
ncbi:30S ribosomal protein S4 [Candidatus Uhrbacteria bacterium]|nr:30S ribosomal protein S4 [Candidatus Uhrbacteria bacterium]